MKVTFTQLADRLSRQVLQAAPNNDMNPSVHVAGLIGKDLARAVFRLWATDTSEIRKEDTLDDEALGTALACACDVLCEFDEK